MSFHRSQCRLLFKPCITCNNTSISYSPGLKFLDMNITENLNWHVHMQLVCSSLSKAYFIIKEHCEFSYGKYYLSCLLSIAYEIRNILEKG
jgi:hypothetical protein